MAHLYWAIAETTLSPDSDAGLAAFERALALAPDNPRINYSFGLALERRKRWAEAAVAFARALALRPGIKEGCFHLGLALESSGQPEAALAAFEQALDRDPDHVGALAAAAALYERAERFADAEAALRRIARLQPEVAYHRYRLARFYERIGEADKARRALDRADGVEPLPERRMRPLKPSRR
jgi:tetratricopeptide (TPR) repeat protein